MGLLDQAQQPPQGAAPQPAPDAAPAQSMPAQTAKPEDVERVVLAAAKLIHSPKVSDELIALMKEQGDPVQALVEALWVVMGHLYERSGNRMPGEVMGAAGVQVLGVLAQLAKAARLFEVTPELLQQAAQAALEKLRGQQSQEPSSGATEGQPMPAEPAMQGGV